MNSKTASHTALDRSDERVRHDEGLFGALRAQITRIKTGDLGTAPVIAGLIVISLVFTFLNPVYIAPNNLVNLLFDCATVGFISLGIVCVLMLGEIDLSVGSMSGLASAIVGVLWVNAGWPLAGAIAVALACGVAVGLVYALLYTRVGMPSFVATLAGLLALLGQLRDGLNMAILLATHDMDLVPLCCDDAYLLGGGRVLAAGTPEELFRQPGLLRENHLRLPRIAHLMDILHDKDGLDAGPAATIGAARREILRLLKEEER